MNNFVMFCGIPASGKSYIANQVINMDCSVVHSSDDLRIKLFGDINDNEHNNELFEILHRNIITDLKQEKNVVMDCTNISYKRRMEFLKRINSINCYKTCMWIATPYEICIEQNKNRERSIPEEVIKRMYLNFYVPQYFEGWDDINIIYNTKGMEFSVQQLFEKLNNVEQETPYHTKTVGYHCLACESLMTEKDTTGDTLLLQAAKLHDIGKEFTKTYNPEKGRCVYYNHHFVSAYNAAFYLQDFGVRQRLEIIKYIQWHMLPFLGTSEKTKNKYVELLGQKFLNKIELLHQCDIEAK